MPSPDRDPAPDEHAVTGRSIAVHLSEEGQVPRPDPPTAIAALVTDGASGERTLAGQASADGSFIIPEVPPGRYWLRHGSDRFIDTDARFVDLSRHLAVRADAARATTGSTRLGFRIGNVSPWQESDDLQLAVPGLGLVEAPLTYSALILPEGMTFILGLTIDWLDVPAPWLIDGRRGDHAYVTQLVRRAASGGVSYLSAERGARALPLVHMDGTTGIIEGTMDGAAPPRALSLRWRRSEFEAWRTSVHPGAVAYWQVLRVNCYPAVHERVDGAALPDLLRMDPDVGTEDLDLAGLIYRNPYPANWQVSMRIHHTYRVEYQVPGTSFSVPLFASIGLSSMEAAGAAGAVAPVVTPIVALRVDGREGQAPISGLAARPRVSWEAPTIGTPAAYILSIHRFALGPQKTLARATRIALLYTDRREVVLPSGLILPGASYVIRVRAVAQPGLHVRQRPYEVTLPSGFAEALSGMLSP